MKAPPEASWERVLNRYFAAMSIPLKWDGAAHRFRGMAGHSFARFNPKARNEEPVWKHMPMYISRYEEKEGRNVIILVTNRQYGDSVDDSMVVMRLGTFMPMLKAFIDTDRERWTDAS